MQTAYQDSYSYIKAESDRIEGSVTYCGDSLEKSLRIFHTKDVYLLLSSDNPLDPQILKGIKSKKKAIEFMINKYVEEHSEHHSPKSYMPEDELRFGLERNLLMSHIFNLEKTRPFSENLGDLTYNFNCWKSENLITADFITSFQTTLYVDKKISLTCLQDDNITVTKKQSYKEHQKIFPLKKGLVNIFIKEIKNLQEFPLEFINFKKLKRKLS